MSDKTNSHDLLNAILQWFIDGEAKRFKQADFEEFTKKFGVSYFDIYAAIDQLANDGYLEKRGTESEYFHIISFSGKAFIKEEGGYQKAKVVKGPYTKPDAKIPSYLWVVFGFLLVLIVALFVMVFQLTENVRELREMLMPASDLSL